MEATGRLQARAKVLAADVVHQAVVGTVGFRDRRIDIGDRHHGDDGGERFLVDEADARPRTGHERR